MHQVQWEGVAVGWDPTSDALYVAVAAAIEPPEVAQWLDQHLADHLRRSLDQTALRCDVNDSRGSSGVPMYQILIRGLTGQLPEPAALHTAVEQALSEGEELASRNEQISATYQSAIRRSR